MPARSREFRQACGFTLLELVVVVAILAVVAGIVLPLSSDATNSASEVATRASLMAIRDAIVGTGSSQRAYRTDIRMIPAKIADLFVRPGSSQVPPFDHWNGPYLRDATGRYVVVAAHGFTNAYGSDGDPAILDGWGHPIVIQIPTSANATEDPNDYARLVSAGSDGVLNAPVDVLRLDLLGANGGDPEGTAAQQGDDLVLYLSNPPFATSLP